MDTPRLFQTRIGLLQVFLRRNGYDGILLSRVDNFAMATGGLRNYVPTATDMGASSLFITKDGVVYFIGNNIERARVEPEEFAGLTCEFRDFLWFDGTPAAVAKEEFSGVLVSDDGSLGENVNGKLAYLRALLTEDELEKYRRLGALAADAITATAQSVRAGQTEADIAARLAAEGAKRRCTMSVILIAADERVLKYRHPLPLQARLLDDGPAETAVRGYVMIVGGFLREGLVVSVTRFARVGDVAASLDTTHARICAVDTLLHEASRPGRTLGSVFVDCQQGYADLEFLPHEWHNHHQGGTTGYAGRTCKAAPGRGVHDSGSRLGRGSQGAYRHRGFLRPCFRVESFRSRSEVGGHIHPVAGRRQGDCHDHARVPASGRSGRPRARDRHREVGDTVDRLTY